MPGTWQISYGVSDIPYAYNIHVEYMFEMLMAVEENITPDELATQTRESRFSSAHTLKPCKVRKKSGYV